MSRQAAWIAGALAGLAAGGPGAAVLWAAGALPSLAAAMSFPAWLVLPVWFGMAAVLGMIYRRIFGAAAESSRYGWLAGSAWGLALWLIGPVAVVGWTPRVPAGPAPAAVGLALAWLAYGLVLGLLYGPLHARLRRRREV